MIKQNTYEKLIQSVVSLELSKPRKPDMAERLIPVIRKQWTGENILTDKLIKRHIKLCVGRCLHGQLFFAVGNPRPYHIDDGKREHIINKGEWNKICAGIDTRPEVNEEDLRLQDTLAYIRNAESNNYRKWR